MMQSAQAHPQTGKPSWVIDEQGNKVYNWLLATWGSGPVPEPELTPQLKIEMLEWLQELEVAPQSKPIDKPV